MKFFVFASLLAAGTFASRCHSQYECCSGCEVVYSDDEGDWGVENYDWCFIDKSKCEATKGYPKCSTCKVYYTDESGDWGVENNDWCLIQSSRCGSSIDKQEPVVSSGSNVIPVIHLISSSGTTDFATKPVEKHIADQAYMGKEKPPEPYYEECNITVEDTDGKKVINGVNGKVKVRGNWTSNYVKKSLKINFSESQSMVGLNGGKKFKSWILLAEYKDGSMLRNKATFAFSREILGKDGLYASDSRLVELKINDEYFGVYLLCEVQQINKGRVDITKVDDDYQGTDMGYLLEYDAGYAMYEEEMESFNINFNDNAALKPYDGQGGNGRTINPVGMSFGGFPGMGGGIGGWGGMPNNGQPNNGQPNNGQWGGFGGNGNQPNNGQPNNGQPNNGQWGGFGGNGNQPNNGQPNNGQPNNGQWGGFGGNGNQPNNEQPNNGQWGGFGNWGGNMKKRQWGGNGSNINMTIKSGANNQQQNSFISNYVNNVYKILYEAAYNKKTLKFNNNYSQVVEASGMSTRQAIENVIDANSLADMFIISEIACDADLYYSSFYMDVDFGANGSKKLRFEAPWDFDSGLGNKDRCADGKGHFAANIIPDNGGFGNTINAWLAVIIYEDWFQDIIRSKWTKAYESGVFTQVISSIRSESNNYAEAFDRNYEKWNNIIDNKQFANELSPGAKKCKTQKEAANYLADWLEKRISFINSNWHN